MFLCFEYHDFFWERKKNVTNNELVTKLLLQGSESLPDTSMRAMSSPRMALWVPYHWTSQ